MTVLAFPPSAVRNCLLWPCRGETCNPYAVFRKYVHSFSVSPHADMSRVCLGRHAQHLIFSGAFWTDTCCHIRHSFCPCCRIFVLSLRWPVCDDKSFPVVLPMNVVCRSSSSRREQCWLPSFCRELKPFMQTITFRDAVSILNDS